jgi:hypothetical protein
MSDLHQVSVALISIGLIGVASLAVYVAAFKQLDLALLPQHCRLRVQAWRRSAPRLIMACGALAVVGLGLAMTRLALL